MLHDGGHAHVNVLPRNAHSSCSTVTLRMRASTLMSMQRLSCDEKVAVSYLLESPAPQQLDIIRVSLQAQKLTAQPSLSTDRTCRSHTLECSSQVPCTPSLRQVGSVCSHMHFAVDHPATEAGRDFAGHYRKKLTLGPGLRSLAGQRSPAFRRLASHMRCLAKQSERTEASQERS